MDRTEAQQSREQHDGLGPFEKFVEGTNQRVSRAPFFFICVALVLLWLISVPLWHDLKTWQVAIHTVSSVISLLLLVLLENAGRRAQEAAQEKLNVIAEGLLALMHSHGETDPEVKEAAHKLQDAIGLEERH